MIQVYSQKTSAKTSFVLTLITVLLSCCFDVAESFAQQKAVVKGIVKDDSGQPLPGVNVVIAGGYSGTSTDPRGEYSIFVTPGTVELEYSFIGNETKKESFEIAAGETKVLDVVLASSVVQLNEVFVIGSLEGQQKALNQQRTADNIKNIVAAEQIGRFPDQNSAEALQRVPGINVQRNEGDGRFVLVRGLAPQYTNISVNGEQIPSPEAGARFVALDAIPANQLASLEVSKALTPDMDGDAIGGSVNLVTQTASSEELQLSASASVEYNNGIEKTTPQGNLSISKRLAGGKFGFILNGSYLASKKGTDRYEFDGWDNDNPDGLDEFGLDDYTIDRNRIGFSSTFDYKFEKGEIYLRTLYSELRELEFRRRLVFASEDDGGLEFETTRELKKRQENQGVYSFNLGGNRVGPKLKFDYEVAFSKAFQDTPFDYDIVFENEEDVTWNFDISNKLNPKVNNFTYDGGAEDYTNSNLFSMGPFEDVATKAEDQNITAKFNMAIPLNIGENKGELKFGGKTRLKDKNYVFNKYNVYEPNGSGPTLLLADFDNSVTDNSFMGGDADPIGTFPDLNLVENYIQSNPGEFDVEEALDEITLEQYEATENVYAAYMQGKIQFNKLMVLGGLRYENTMVDYKSGLWDDENEAVIPIEGENDYGFLLPMLHFKYSVNKNTNIRAAITRSYSRPNFADLVQGGEYSQSDAEATISNPELKPVQATNIDLFGEHYLGTVGILSGGIFYKKLSDFIYQQTTDQTFQGDPNVEVTQAINGDNASLFGFEVAWQQNLTFLPGILGGLGVYANYTYTASNAEVENFAQGDELTEIDLPGQSEHVGNVALTYTKGGFSGRVTVNFNGAFISEIDGGDLVLIDSRTQLDASLSQTFAKKFTVFAELVNLNNAEQIELYNTEATPKRREQYSFWTRFGLRYKF